MARRSADEWRKGFLAGIFDAEGSYGGSCASANTDPEILDWTRGPLADWGSTMRSRTGVAQRMRYVRIRGGLPEHLRFFHIVDPAITRKRSIEGPAIKTRRD